MRVCEFASLRVCEFVGWRVCEFASLRVCGSEFDGVCVGLVRSNEFIKTRNKTPRI
jgi:hypothetical protein